MSRIGRKVIAIPSGVSIEQAQGEVRVRGPKGALARQLPPSIEMQVEGSELSFARTDERKAARAYHGLARAMVANMVVGVTQGFARELQIEGVGYRAEASGKKLTLALGFSHPIVLEVPGRPLGLGRGRQQDQDRGHRSRSRRTVRSRAARAPAAGALQGQGRSLLG